MSDSMIDDIRKTRDGYATRFNYDVDAMFDDLRRREGKSGHKLMSSVAKRKKTRAAKP